MKFRWWFGIVFNLILAFLAISGAVFYVVHVKDSSFLSGRTLEIRDTSTGKLYGRWPFEEAGEFSMEFIHSVHKNPVRESFRPEGKMIRLQALRFFSFGAGMPSHLEEGQVLGRDGDAMVITGFSAAFRELNYVIGPASDLLLFINGQTVSLGDLCGSNAGITIRLK